MEDRTCYEILLVDDHRMFRDGIKSLLERQESFKVVGEADNGADAVQFCRDARPDLVLMDIGLPGLDGIEATIEIHRHCPECKVIILSMYDDEGSVIRAIRSGARGFVLKCASSEDLLDALRIVGKGGLHLCAEVANYAPAGMQRGGGVARPLPPVLETLCPREMQVLRLIAEGKTSKEIAAMLAISIKTVQGYRKAMMKKIGVNNAAGVTQLAFSAGLARRTVL